MTPACYAQRLLNPFRGVMNIIEYQGAEAVTTDGLNWDIYVRDTGLVEDMADSHKVQTSDIRYGSWSKQQGLKRGAIYPSDDFKILEHRGAVVYDYLLHHQEDIPFPFRDNYELWLLDERNLPLALLNSAIREEDIDFDARIDWRAGIECGKHFRSAAADTPSAGACLTTFINALAGKTPRAQWFRRVAGGTATGLAGINLPTALGSRHLDDTAFPEFFVREHEGDHRHQQLLADFIAWQAPCLLLLQHLDRQTRAHFEQLAMRRALSVQQHYRLYPAIIDSDAIKAARVEALLRAGEPDTDSEDEAMATYYIELNVTRTN